MSDGNFGHTEMRRGRPKSSRLVAVTFKLEPELLRRVDQEAARMSVGRSEALRTLLAHALDAAPPKPSELLSQIVLEAVLALDAEGRFGGIVPLPALRDRLTMLEPTAGRTDVDAALIALERDFRVDLCVAQSPMTIEPSARALGIARPGRGLVFYVAPR